MSTNNISMQNFQFVLIDLFYVNNMHEEKLCLRVLDIEMTCFGNFD